VNAIAVHFLFDPLAHGNPRTVLQDLREHCAHAERELVANGGDPATIGATYAPAQFGFVYCVSASPLKASN
jgi:hypothetical protein